MTKLEEGAGAGSYATPRLAAPELTLPRRLEPPPRKQKTETDAAADVADDAAGDDADATGVNAEAVIRMVGALLCQIYAETIERFSASLLPEGERENYDDDVNKIEKQVRMKRLSGHGTV